MMDEGKKQQMKESNHPRYIPGKNPDISFVTI